MEIIDHPLACWSRARVIPAQARPVIQRNGRMLRKAPLDLCPLVARLSQGRRDYDGGAALAGPPQMQPAIADVDQLPRRRKPASVTRLTDDLVHGVGQPESCAGDDAGG